MVTRNNEAKVVGMARQTGAELVEQREAGEESRSDEADWEQPDERHR